MNRKRLMLLLLAAVITTVAVLLPLQAGLGFGDFDSGSDWGGSDSGGSDWGGSDWGGSDWDWGSSSSGSSSRSSGRSGSSGLAIVVWIIIIIVWLMIKFAGYESQRSRRQETARRREPERPENSGLEELTKRDPLFDRLALFEWCKELFVKMQETWEQGDITPVQYGFTVDAWNRFNTQLQMKNARGETTHVRDIDITSVQLVEYSYNSATEKLLVSIVAEYNVWVTNREGKNIQGSPSTRHRMHYRWTLQRPSGTLTPGRSAAQQDKEQMRCPHCGAELDLSAFAECPFCKAQISGSKADWLVADITAVSQLTIHK